MYKKTRRYLKTFDSCKLHVYHPYRDPMGLRKWFKICLYAR